MNIKFLYNWILIFDDSFFSYKSQILLSTKMMTSQKSRIRIYITSSKSNNPDFNKIQMVLKNREGDGIFKCFLVQGFFRKLSLKTLFPSSQCHNATPKQFPLYMQHSFCSESEHHQRSSDYCYGKFRRPKLEC